MLRYSGKRLFEMMDDGQDNTLLQAADRYKKEENVLDDELDKFLSQSLDMFEKLKKLAHDVTDITDMFELCAPRLVMARRFRTQTEVIRLENLAAFL